MKDYLNFEITIRPLVDMVYVVRASNLDRAVELALTRFRDDASGVDISDRHVKIESVNIPTPPVYTIDIDEEDYS